MEKIFSKKNSLIIGCILVLILISTLIGSELILRNIPNDYQYKANYLKQNGSKIKTLILGNSHTLNGINPTLLPNAFNAAHSAQPYEYDWKILEKNYSNLPHLKTIIIPVSYFSYTINFKEGGLKNRIKDYNIYYGIHTGDYSLKNNFEIFHQSIDLNYSRFKKFQINPVNEINSNLDGSPKKRRNIDINKYNSTETVKKHTYPYDQNVINGNIYYLNQILNFSQKNNIKVILVSFPTSKTYFDNMDLNQFNHWKMTTTDLTTKYSNVSWMNFLEDSGNFDQSDFIDADHLNQQGADKLTQQITFQLQ